MEWLLKDLLVGGWVLWFIAAVLPIVVPLLLWEGFARWDRFVDRTFKPGGETKGGGGQTPPHRQDQPMRPGAIRSPDESGIGDEEWENP